MGYAPDPSWYEALVGNAFRAGDERTLVAIDLTVQRACDELEWKMRRTPEFDDSGSVTRALHDLLAAREGLAALRKRK